MKQRHFHMRMQCRYSTPENTIDELEVEHIVDGHWVPLDLDTRTAGFDIFVYAIFTCQHMYFRTNAAERGLVLKTAEAEIEVIAREDWDMESLSLLFVGTLDKCTAGQDTIDDIVGRMRQCPVSRNIRVAREPQTTVEFI